MERDVPGFLDADTITANITGKALFHLSQTRAQWRGRNSVSCYIDIWSAMASKMPLHLVWRPRWRWLKLHNKHAHMTFFSIKILVLSDVKEITPMQVNVDSGNCQAPLLIIREQWHSNRLLDNNDIQNGLKGHNLFLVLTLCIGGMHRRIGRPIRQVHFILQRWTWVLSWPAVPLSKFKRQVLLSQARNRDKIEVSNSLTFTLKLHRKWTLLKSSPSSR